MVNMVNPSIPTQEAQKNNQANKQLFDSAKSRSSTARTESDVKGNHDPVAIAKDIRSDIAAKNHVNESLAVGKGVIDVAVRALDSLSNHLGRLKESAPKITEESFSKEERKQAQEKYDAHIDEMRKAIVDASFEDVNLLDNSREDYQVPARTDGENITVHAHDMTRVIDSVEKPPVTPDDAAAALDPLAAASDTVNAAKASLKEDYRTLHGQMDFNSALADAAETTLGARVDADLAKEDAQQQAIHANQQLSGQALGIANRAPQSLINLFR